MVDCGTTTPRYRNCLNQCAAYRLACPIGTGHCECGWVGGNLTGVVAQRAGSPGEGNTTEASRTLPQHNTTQISSISAIACVEVAAPATWTTALPVQNTNASYKLPNQFLPLYWSSHARLYDTRPRDTGYIDQRRKLKMQAS